MRHTLRLRAGLVALLAVASTLVLAESAPAAPPCSDGVDRVGSLDFGPRDPAGRHATGAFALPASTPRSMVVFAHGYGVRGGDFEPYLLEAARRGAVAIAMDYRGTGPPPHNRGWPVVTGAEDSILAARHYLDRCPSILSTVLLGVSMGGNVSGYALAAAPRRAGGAPLFDYWVVVEGVSNMSQTYSQLVALGLTGNPLAVSARSDMETETGGSLAQFPDRYHVRSIVHRTADIRTGGLRGTIIVHGVDDGIVPYDQARQLAHGLASVRIPTELVTVVRGRDDGDFNSTNYAGQGSPLAGHGWSPDHVVIRAGLASAWSLLAGYQPPPYRETVVDEPLASGWRPGRFVETDAPAASAWVRLASPFGI